MRGEIEVRELVNVAKFFETLARDPSGNGIDLDYYQVGYMQDTHPFLAMDKARRIGYSWAEAATGLFKSQTVIRRTMPYVYSKYFISRNLDESKEKITLARVFHDMLPKDHRLKLISDQKTELIFEDNYGRLSRLKALTAQPPRGPGGDVNIDEAGWIRNLKKIYEAALPIIGEGQGMQLTIGSTPAGKNGLFYDIITNKKNSDGSKSYKHFKRYRVPWWLSRNLCTDVFRASIEAPKLTTKERVYRYGTKILIQIFESTSLDNFIREFECGFMDESAAYMPYDLIMSCTVAEHSPDPSDSESKYLFKYFSNELSESPSASFWKELRVNRRGMYEIGFDVGAKKDVSALCLTEEIGGRKKVRALVKLDKSPLPVQEKILREAFKTLQPFALRIDVTGGLGLQMYQKLSKEFGEQIEDVYFNVPSKTIMATGVKAAFERREIEIPDHPEFIDHIHSIERIVSNASIKFEADASEHHGDFFWGLGLCYYREKRMVTSGGFMAKGNRFNGIR